ncbi:kinase-like protein, partial [Ramicandelaber brevisporus]
MQQQQQLQLANQQQNQNQTHQNQHLSGNGNGNGAHPTESRLITPRRPPLPTMTTKLLDFFRVCDPNYGYKQDSAPRRALTKPSKGAGNNGNDNENGDYILYINDILGEDHRTGKYKIIESLGAGTFGQVVKCEDLLSPHGQIVAVKVIKNQEAYYRQSMHEVMILSHVKNMYDPDEYNMTRLLRHFVWRDHLFIVFELLAINLYDVLKQNEFRGVSATTVRVISNQILKCLDALHTAGYIHCDLKPENCMVVDRFSSRIKVIDFGSACDASRPTYTYIQSRFYRSPEVLLGCTYTASIDMWSLGCIVAELVIGLPVFPGASEYDQVARIVQALRVPPSTMVEAGTRGQNLFEQHQYQQAHQLPRRSYELMSREMYAQVNNTTVPQATKKYVEGDTLGDMIWLARPVPFPSFSGMDAMLTAFEPYERIVVIDFLYWLLQMDPRDRATPRQALNHPFSTDQLFTQP